MSLVKVQGNASGTGTLTIAAPSTNSDRTLTLPDQTGTLLTGSGAIGVNASAPVPSVSINASGNVGIGTASPGALLDVSAAGTAVAKLTNRNSGATEVVLSLDAGGNGVSVRDSQIRGGNNGANQTYLSFYTSPADTPVERARIDSSGNLLMGTSAFNYAYTGNAFQFNAEGYGIVSHSATTEYNCFVFNNGNGHVGAINTIGSSTVYLTSSDYRLKENVQPMQNALVRVAALKPVTYKWKVDGSDGEGFIAHELQAVVPECVNGEKDAVDAEGNPRYQGIDTSFLVATLTAAIQELKAIVDAQGAEIAALKGQA